MADTKPTPGAGDVTLTLGGEEITLRCTPEAALALCRETGGLYGTAAIPGVSHRVMACDIDTMCVVIRAGLGLTGSAVKDLPKQVYEYGLLDLRSKLAVFIGAVANGGKPIQTEGAGEEDGRPPAGAGA